MESVWSEDLEDKLIDLWQQYVSNNLSSNPHLCVGLVLVF